MTKAERSYLVPCSCSARLPVTAGQAGGTIVCRACGREIDVPRLRELAAFAVEPGRAEAPATAAPGRGMIVAGSVVAVAAAALAVALVPLGRFFFSQPPTPEVIRAAIDAAPPASIQFAWQALAATGVHRPPTAEELQLQQFAAHASGVAMFLWGVAVLGALLVAAGLACRALSRTRSSAVGPR